MKGRNFKILLLLLFFTLTFLFATQKQVGKILGSKNTSMPSWFLNSFLDLKEDIEEQTQANKRLIIFVHQNSCPYCYKFVNTNLKDEKTKNKIQENFSIVDINMFGNKEVTDLDDKTYSEKEFAKKYKIQFTPTLLFFNENKKEILRLNGYITLKKFNLALDYVKDKKENILTFNDYLKENTREKNVLEKERSKLFTSSSKNLRRDLNNKILAVFFEFENCFECQKMHNLFLKDKIIQKMLSKIDVALIDMHSNEALVTPNKIIQYTQEWVKSLNITYNPSVIFFDKEGKEIIRIEANFKRFHLQSIVEYVVSETYKTQGEFQRYLNQRANRIREKGLDVDIWKD